MDGYQHHHLLLGSAVVVSLFVVVALFVGALSDDWDGPALVAAGLLWIAYFNASIHHTVEEEVRLRLDRLQGELAEQQERNKHELAAEITKKANQDAFLEAVAREVRHQQHRGDDPHA
ncbi:hypothetical protein [Actinopolyspora halophila]|uniref:hypothetical protein n=1 Tax=Actinopolyspora halophila TaxID=1850 RepID=UPI00035D9CE8|nr:hypothetical protein [Actinopolyspora halophila]